MKNELYEKAIDVVINEFKQEIIDTAILFKRKENINVITTTSIISIFLSNLLLADRVIIKRKDSYVKSI